MIYPAHIRDEGMEIKSVQEHSHNVASIAGNKLSKVQLSHTGYLCGLVHDVGKFTTTFKDYLERAAAGAPVQPGSVIHTFGAARFFLERYHSPDSCVSFKDMTAELCAYAGAAHHGLFDCVNERHTWGFLDRMSWDDVLYQEAKTQFFSQCADEQTVDRLFDMACQELAPIYNWINGQAGGNEEIFFYLGLLTRLLLSAVVEGDRVDTALFMGNETGSSSGSFNIERWQLLQQQVEDFVSAAVKTPVQKARRNISQLCQTAASGAAGIYLLIAPAGSGKTVGSLRFAASHAAEHHKEKIVFVSGCGFGKNTELIERIVGNEQLITEYKVGYSDPLTDEFPEELLLPEQREDISVNETWNRPVVITTFEQLLRVMCAGDMDYVRCFQALCGSVLIFDEIQGIPISMNNIFKFAVRFLVHICGATVILNSSIQLPPEQAAWLQAEDAINLVPDEDPLISALDRTVLVNAGAKRLKDVPEFISRELCQNNSLLVICNTKEEMMYLSQKVNDDMDTVCFSFQPDMNRQERQNVVKQMKRALNLSQAGGKKVLCISTPLIEFNAEVSFACVIRFAAGLDDAVRAAGLCNREKETPLPSPVFVLTCSDEDLGKDPFIQNKKTAFLQFLYTFSQNQSKFEQSLSSPASVACYFNYLYGGLRAGATGGPWKNGYRLLDLLSVNGICSNDLSDWGRFGLHQAFSMAGYYFSHSAMM